MRRITKKWLEYAKCDFEAADVLLRSAKTHRSYQLCVLHCHQALEKILKTLIIDKGTTPKRTHDLVQLLTESKLLLYKGAQEYINELNPHYQPSRYPDITYKGPILRYSKKIAHYHFKKTKELFLWIEKELKRRSKK